MSKSPTIGKRRLLDKIVCPHCWTQFPPEDVLWIAESPNLTGDMKLGETERERFLPTEYNARGFAVDAQGCECRECACPRCHLPVPLSLLEAPTLFMSIVGAPASGKSYYLASSTWFLRKILPRCFKLNFSDADPNMNRRLQEYEALLFLGDENRLVELPKTEEQGDLYNSVRYDDQVVVYPQPFVFSVKPSIEHPHGDKAAKLSRTICLYDNAGESYLPTRDADSFSFPVTRHLGQSECVFFLFDPTQDARFRSAIKERSNDPRLADANDWEERRLSQVRQETIFTETIKRIRSARRMYANDRFDGLLIVVLTKYDAWRDLLPCGELQGDPIARAEFNNREIFCLRADRVARVSSRARAMLMKRAPEFVSAAENFANDVVYVPVSASGVSPEIDRAANRRGFRPKNVRPIWIATPMLLALSRLTKGLAPIHAEDAPETR